MVRTDVGLPTQVLGTAARKPALRAASLDEEGVFVEHEATQPTS